MPAMAGARERIPIFNPASKLPKYVTSSAFATENAPPSEREYNLEENKTNKAKRPSLHSSASHC